MTVLSLKEKTAAFKAGTQACFEINRTNLLFMSVFLDKNALRQISVPCFNFHSSNPTYYSLYYM